MTKEEILVAARQMAAAGLPFIFATVDEKGAPQARWMGGLALDEPFVVYMMTAPQARKMAQIKSNPRGELVFHSPDYSHVVTVSGNCEACDDPLIKQRLWAAIPQLARIVTGPEDPNFGVVRFTGRHIEMFDVVELPPHVEMTDL